MINTQSSTKQPDQSGRATVSQPDVEPTLTDVANDALESFRKYAAKRPEVVAFWCLGAGFVLGWRLKPW